MKGVVNVEWHGQDYLHLKWHVVCSGLATPVLVFKLAKQCSGEVEVPHFFITSYT